VAIDRHLFPIVMIEVLLFFNLAAIFELFYFLFRLLQLIKKAMVNRIGLVLITVSRTSPFKIFLYLEHQSLYHSSYVSLVKFTDGGGGGSGAKPFAIKKAWGSIDCSLFNPL
jgi:hypothetical protein